MNTTATATFCMGCMGLEYQEYAVLPFVLSMKPNVAYTCVQCGHTFAKVPLDMISNMKPPTRRVQHFYPDRTMDRIHTTHIYPLQE